MDRNEILLIHLGGLGDMCLSESTFYSLSEHFREGVVALGYTRFLKLFEQYFKRIERIESARWLPLFSQHTPDMEWKRIVFVGKDRGGALREKWGKMSRDEMIFVEMYPDAQSPIRTPKTEIKQHVENFQLMQLRGYGIKAKRKGIISNASERVILNPEKGFKKEKWGYENFVSLYHSLKAKGVDAHILASLGLEKDVKEALFFEDLTDIKDFFKHGGVFVSNDCGMAHLAGMCGLYTIAMFMNFDRATWHPRGEGRWLQLNKDKISVSSMESIILETINMKRPSNR